MTPDESSCEHLQSYHQRPNSLSEGVWHECSHNPLRSVKRYHSGSVSSSASSVKPGGQWAARPQQSDLTSSGQDLCGTGTPAAGYLATVTGPITSAWHNVARVPECIPAYMQTRAACMRAHTCVSCVHTCVCEQPV